MSISAIHRQRGHRALLIASENGHVEVVRLLLDRGADIQAKTIVSYITMASYFG
jgi:ankyrin repeat protein